jgi:hypothetical protein
MQLTLTEAQVIAEPDGTVVVRGNEGEIVFRGQCAKQLQRAFANQENVDISVNFTERTGLLGF